MRAEVETPAYAGNGATVDRRVAGANGRARGRGGDDAGGGGGGNGRAEGNSRGPKRTPKTEVLVPGLHPTNDGLREVSNDAFADSVLDALPDGLLYRSAGGASQGRSVGVIEGAAGCREFDPAGPDDFRLFVDERCRLMRWDRTVAGNIRKELVNCTEGQAKLVMARARRSSKVRHLVRLVHSPVYLPGFRLTAPGWTDGTYYDPAPALDGLAPETDGEVIAQVLDDLVVDFPFKDVASRHNFFGLLLTPLLRPALDGNVPMHLVLASLERTGKSKLLEEVLGGVILGRPTPALQMTADEAELDKRLFSLLQTGETIVHMDNLGQFINSPVLASLITTSNYHGRELGRSTMKRLPNTLTVTASGNNVRATGEIVKRIVPIRLQPEDDHPELRTAFIHADLRAYVAGVRRNVLACLLGMVARWSNVGRPDGKLPMGGFEAWARIVGGIMAVNGFDQWMSNAGDWRKAADPEGEDLKHLVREWARLWGRTAQAAKEIVSLAQRLELFPRIVRGDSANGIYVKFARQVLSAATERPVLSFMIERDKSGSSSMYRLSGTDAAFEAVRAESPPNNPFDDEEAHTENLYDP